MDKYKSLYERLIEKFEENGQIVKLSPEDNLLILKELGNGMGEFVNDQRIKERNSEMELSSTVLR